MGLRGQGHLNAHGRHWGAGGFLHCGGGGEVIRFVCSCHVCRWHHHHPQRPRAQRPLWPSPCWPLPHLSISPSAAIKGSDPGASLPQAGIPALHGLHGQMFKPLWASVRLPVK